MPYLVIALASVGATLTAGGIIAGLYQTWQHGRRIADLERRVGELEPAARHDKLSRAQMDIGEAFIFNLVALAEQENVIRARIEYAIRMAEGVRAGMKPDDVK